MRTALVVCILAAATTAGAGAQQPPVQELIARAVSYVEAYEQQLSGLVAQEDYVQLIVGAGRTRHLQSDFLLVRTTTQEPWRPFRDVYSVDGRSVRDRQERLERLFSAGNTLEARRLHEESARYNLGDVQRNINVPILALQFLKRFNVDHFEFSLDRLDRLDGAPAWRVDFRERDRPTLIKSGERDLPADGSFWIRERDGAVLKTRVHVPILLQDGSRSGDAEIQSIYCRPSTMDVLVPCAMAESYRTRKEEIRGRATYSNIRRFATATAIEIK